MDKHLDALTEISELCKTATPEEKKLLTEEFFLIAMDAFNDHIAGDITTADGRTINIPVIEL